MSIYDGQQYEHNTTHFLRLALDHNDAAGTYSMGWVPHNASIIRGGVNVHEVFDAGTNNRLDIGYRNGGDGETDDTDEYGTDVSLLTAGIIVADELATAGVNHFPKGAEIVAVLDLTGTAATTGECIVWVEYLVDNTGSVTDFG